VEAIRQIDSVAEACTAHIHWILTSLNQCAIEGKEGIREFAARLEIAEIRELVEVLSSTLDLLQSRSSGGHREGLLAELLNEDLAAAFVQARGRLCRLCQAFNSK